MTTENEANKIIRVATEVIWERHKLLKGILFPEEQRQISNDIAREIVSRLVGENLRIAINKREP